MKKKKQQKKIEIEKYLPGLFARTEGYASNVSKYYTAAVNALLDLAASVDLEPEEVFYFADHKKLSVKATNVLRGLYTAVYQEIRRGVIAEWEFANLSNDAMIESIFGKGLKEDNHYARWFSRNHDAMDAFFKRKSEYGGLNLSQKVWKYTGQFKEEMELALSASLGQGDSAATVSRHVRQYLKEPDRLFRRVRDEEGNLKLSKRAAAYHPGRGEYRSSYKNAMRLARTETNMAYRAADCERWNDIPFVVGMEVKRSNHPFACSVCEALAGKYPKDFKFVGWHPQCRCYIVPILADEKDRMAYHRAVLNGEDVEGWKFEGEIAEPHAGFQKWMNDNSERVEKARERGTLPYWVKDNEKYVEAAQHTEQGNKGIKQETDKHTKTTDSSVANVNRKAVEHTKEMKRQLDQYQGATIEDDCFLTGQMRVLRRSLTDIIEHDREDETLMQWLSELTLEDFKGWNYEGWAHNRPYEPGHPKYDPKNPNRPKHPETDYFLYYSKNINGKKYWANVKMHKDYNGEVLYTIEPKKPEDIINGKP